MYFGFLFVFAFITLTFQKTDKIKKLAFILWPAKDALQNNFDATPAYILQKLKAGKSKKATTGIVAYFENSKRIIEETQATTSQQFEKA
jgi:hypothetical protein